MVENDDEVEYSSLNIPGYNHKIREQLELPMYKTESPVENISFQKRLGTFQDNLRTPIHRWFKYPAGYSYRLVETLIKDYGLKSDSWLLDPFVGCGTTSVVAKCLGVSSIGIEAHPFIHWVAQTKCFWEFNMEILHQNIQKLLSYLYRMPEVYNENDLSEFPELVHKCYSKNNLWVLKGIRDHLNNCIYSKEENDFFRLALADTLRTASKAGTGWPYISPNKHHEKNEQPALEVFHKTVVNMYQDLLNVLSNSCREQIETRLLLMDARDNYPFDSESVDLAVTSPPYLNNYDYADRTRLEMYFFGWAKTWRDITNKVRGRLITSATTQIVRGSFSSDPLNPVFRDLDPELYRDLIGKIYEIRKIRPEKGGKKSYDLMVAGYFNDMLLVIKQIYQVLKPSANFILVLGDSAPYGVYIPTDEYLGRLAISIGFRDYYIKNLRERGKKWRQNPQRHNVMLKEGILTLVK